MFGVQFCIIYLVYQNLFIMLIRVYVLLFLTLTLKIVITQKNNKYVAVLRHVDTFNYDESYAHADAKAVHINRTLKGLDADVTVFKPANDSVMVGVVFHKWINNNWVKYSALQFTESIKKFINLELFDVQSLFKVYCKPPLEWPWQVTTYRIRNFVFNSEVFPPFIPTGKYRADVTFYASKKKSDRVFELDLHAEFVPIKPQS